MTISRNVALGTVLFACSATLCFGQESKPPDVNPCVADGQISPQALARLAELQSITEKDILYAIPAASNGVKECHISADPDVSQSGIGMLQLEYRFKNGGWLRVLTHDGLELWKLETHYLLPSTQDPIALMKLEAKDSFGDNSCGIDWKKPEVIPVDSDKGANETVYWGDGCNCRVGIRRDSKNRVVGLAISSICN